jgi:glycosyltransferase involved in cell wall biosynthesis
LRKGLRVLIAAMRALRHTHAAELHLFGPLAADFSGSLHSLLAEPGIVWHGSIAQAALADAMRQSSVLVLPSWEEAFGLVVPQALNCGTPCVVSDRVGAQDLIAPRGNGSIFPAGDVARLTEEVAWWLDHPDRFSCPPITWDGPAARLLQLTHSYRP